MSTLLDQFRGQYDSGKDFEFDDIHYRPGAAWSTGMAGHELCFGLTEGYHVNNAGELAWGWVRIHTGEDRANGAREDGVLVPFDNDRTALHLDADTQRIYGSLLRLISHGWGFEVRIAHMSPNLDIAPWVLPQVLDNGPLALGARIGQAGKMGQGNHRHTHTEMVSTGATSPLLDEILLLKYGEAVIHEYGRDEVLAEYNRYPQSKKMSGDAAMRDYDILRGERGISWANRFKNVFRDPYSRSAPRTRYSSRLLFGM